MGSYTPHYNLYLPTLPEHVDIAQLDNDFTLLDTAVFNASNVVISDLAPATNTVPAKYLWIQTGLAPGGTGISFWIETGA